MRSPNSSIFTIFMICVFKQSDSQTGGILNYEIYEETPAETFIGQIREDAKLNNFYTNEELPYLKYNLLTQDNPNSDYFTIHRDTGDFRTRKKLDREIICPQLEVCKIEVDVIIQPKEYFRVVKVIINIIDINDSPPIFLQSNLKKTISENSAIGFSMVLPTADDLDSPKYGIKNYELTSQNTEFELVTINSQNSMTGLSLILTTELDRETREFYQVIISAFDKGINSNVGQLVIDIQVIDVNDNSPIFEKDIYEINIKENTRVGETLLKLTATDQDTGINGEVVYSFDTKTKHNYGMIFDINEITGEISLIDSLNFIEQNEYELNVIARDKNPESESANTVIKVAIQDINDHAPEISINAFTDSGKVEVVEDDPMGTFVALLKVFDEDSDINGQFICNLQSDEFQLKQVDTNSYQINTDIDLDRESTSSYEISFNCEDKGQPSLSSIQSIHIDVLDVNDNKPIFEKNAYSVTIYENNRIGLGLIQVKAYDLDSGLNGQIEYDLQGSGSFYIEVNRFSGNVTAISRFNYEDSHEYSFDIIAYDKGKPRQETSVILKIFLKDEDDEYPTFESKSFDFQIRENMSTGSEIGTVVATDRDSSSFNKFHFYINPLYGNDTAFYIDPDTGKLFTRKELDRELKNFHIIEVIAESDLSSKMSSSCFVNIFVLDVNDCPPVVLFPTLLNNSIQVRSSSKVGFVITRIYATDKDDYPNNELKYRIINGNGNVYFNVDKGNGNVYVASSLKDLNTKVFQITVEVQDNGFPMLSTSTTLNIIVKAEPNTVLSSQNLTIVISVVIVTLTLTIILIIAIFAVKRKSNRLHKQYTHSNGSSTAKVISGSDDFNNLPINNSFNESILHHIKCHEFENSDCFCVEYDHNLSKEIMKNQISLNSLKDNQMLYTIASRCPSRTPSLDCHSLACDSITGKVIYSNNSGQRESLSSLSRNMMVAGNKVSNETQLGRPRQNDVKSLENDLPFCESISNSDSGRGSNEGNDTLNLKNGVYIKNLPNNNSEPNHSSRYSNNQHYLQPHTNNQSLRNDINAPAYNIHMIKCNNRTFRPSTPISPTNSLGRYSEQYEDINRTLPRRRSPQPTNFTSLTQSDPSLSINNSRYEDISVPSLPQRTSLSESITHNPPRYHMDKLIESIVDEESEPEWSDEDKEYVYYIDSSQV